MTFAASATLLWPASAAPAAALPPKATFLIDATHQIKASAGCKLCGELARLSRKAT